MRSAKSVNVIKYRRKKAVENYKKLKSLKHFYKKLTLKVKSYKNGKKALKVMSSFLTEKTNSCGVLTVYFGKETFTVNKAKHL